MSEWWTYGPEDFLLFSPRVYWRMFELQNEAAWPLQLVTTAGGLVSLFVLHRQRKRGGAWIGIFLAMLWIFVGWSFVWNRYAAINWAIAYVAPIFLLQAILLLAAALRGEPTFDRRDFAGWIGLLLAVAGLLLYPLLPLLAGRSWASAEVFGLAPDPTAIVTLGLLTAGRGRLPFMLLPVPLLWCLISGLTLWAMGDGQAWLPLLVGPVVLVSLGQRMASGLRRR